MKVSWVDSVGRCVSTDDIVQGCHSLTQVVVSDTSHLGLVTDLVTNLLLIHQEMVEKVTLAAPEVVGEAEAGEEGVGGQLPDGKLTQQVAIQSQHSQVFQVGKCLSSNTYENIELRIKNKQIFLQILYLLAR